MNEPNVDDLVFDQAVLIDASRDVVWQAITDPKVVSQYYICPLVTMDLEQGGAVVYGSAERPLISGQVLDFTTGNELVHSFKFDLGSHPGVSEDKSSRVTYTLGDNEGKISLRLVHDHFEGDQQTYENVSEGWPIILDRLKTYLEHGGMPDSKQ